MCHLVLGYGFQAPCEKQPKPAVEHSMITNIMACYGLLVEYDIYMYIYIYIHIYMYIDRGYVGITDSQVERSLRMAYVGVQRLSMFWLRFLESC